MKYLLIAVLMLSGCATHSEFEQLKTLSINIAKAHNLLVDRVAKLEATPTPVSSPKK